MEKNTSNYTTFYIVRHGQTLWNIEHKIQGHSDTELTELGVQQAENLARQFHDIQFDAALSSDLLRAKRTAEIIALEKKLAIQTTSILRERHYGVAEGKRSQDYAPLWEKWRDMSDKEQVTQRIAEGAENDEEIGSRFITFLREAAVAYSGKTVLVVSHGAIMSVLLIKLGYATYKTLHRIENCGWYVVESDGIDFSVTQTSGVQLYE